MKKTPWLPVWITVVTALVCLSAYLIWPSPQSRTSESKENGKEHAQSHPDTVPHSTMHAIPPEEPGPDTAMSRRWQLKERQAAEPSVVGPEERASVNGEEKIAYMTFDDGPSVNTDKILDILRDYGAKATFFVIGRESEDAARLYRRIAAEGHQLGNHTYSHDYKRIYSSVEAYMKDTEKLNRLLEATAGVSPRIVRFPAGSNHRLAGARSDRSLMPAIIHKLSEEGYRYYDWNVSSTDAARVVQPKDEIVGAVLESSREKQRIIVIMHDVNVKTTTVEALPEVLQGLQRRGFRFEALDDRTTFTHQFLKP